MQQRGELDVPPPGRIQAEGVGDREREVDDVAAVRSGVVVVRFNDVSKQEGGAAIGGAEGKLMLDALLALAREQPEQTNQRQDEEDEAGALESTQRRRGDRRRRGRRR